MTHFQHKHSCGEGSSSISSSTQSDGSTSITVACGEKLPDCFPFCSGEDSQSGGQPRYQSSFSSCFPFCDSTTSEPNFVPNEQGSYYVPPGFSDAHQSNRHQIRNVFKPTISFSGSSSFPEENQYNEPKMNSFFQPCFPFCG